MTFDIYTILFITLTLTGFYLINPEYRLSLLVLASSVFVLLQNRGSLVVMLLITFITYIAGICIYTLPKSNAILKKVLLFLVVNPYPTTASDEIIFNRIHEMADEEGILFRSTNYDSRSMGLNFDEDYNDRSHLNYTGSRKYSSFLAKLLKEEFDLPDRRGNEKYDSRERNAEYMRKVYGGFR